MSPDVINSILVLYNSENRKYHNTKHIASMIENSLNYDLNSFESMPLMLAIYYHDIIYIPGADVGQNEQRSADLFQTHVNNGFFDEYKFYGDTILEIKQAIFDTINHVPTQESDLSKYLIDLDLWELSIPFMYEQNKHLIREEFKHLSEGEWIIGRSQWLKSMLERDQIYYTDYCKDNGFESNARVNISNELAIYERLNYANIK